MIGKLNHIAIAVPNINEAAEQYRSIFGAKVSEPVEQPDHGVTTIFIDLGTPNIFQFPIKYLMLFAIIMNLIYRCINLLL